MAATGLSTFEEDVELKARPWRISASCMPWSENACCFADARTYDNDGPAENSTACGLQAVGNGSGGFL
jgi:hypothetical protein